MKDFGKPVDLWGYNKPTGRPDMEQNFEICLSSLPWCRCRRVMDRQQLRHAVLVEHAIKDLTW